MVATETWATRLLKKLRWRKKKKETPPGEIKSRYQAMIFGFIWLGSVYSLHYLHIINDLTFGVSVYTLHDLNSYKSLEAHAQFTSNWVQNLHKTTAKLQEYSDICKGIIYIKQNKIAM